MTILVAGFSTFPGAPSNPCERMVRVIGGRTLSSGRELATVVLPVEWAGSWRVLRDTIESARSRAVLMFGLNARAERVKLELRAENARELGRPDAIGAFPSGPAVADGPQKLNCRLPIGACAVALRRVGVDFEVSQDAGRYICNDTFYRLCQYGEAGGLDHWGFIHSPLTDEDLETWQRAGALPDRCRSLDADVLTRAALALADVIDLSAGAGGV